MRRPPRAGRWAAAALALACLAAPLAEAVDWCYPKLAATLEQPCPSKEQCCSIWGVCGKGLHYCAQGHCAGGACVGTPVVPEHVDPNPDNPFGVGGDGGSTPSPSPPSPVPSPPTPSPVQSPPASSPPPSPAPSLPAGCGQLLQDVDFVGADLPDGEIGFTDSMAACCKACGARPECGVYTWNPAYQTCHLKAKTGWQLKTVKGVQSAVKPGGPSSPVPSPSPVPSSPLPPSPKPSPPPPSPKPSPSPSPVPIPSPPPAPPATCGAIKQDTDLNGAELPDGGMENIVSPEACCAACIARQDCGAWTYAPLSEICYLKAATGWVEKLAEGLQSAVMSNRNTTVVIVDPNPPVSPPPPSPSPSPSPPTTPGAPPSPTPGAPPSPSPGDPYAPGPYQFVDLTEDQKRRMYELTSIFENADTDLQYNYAERLGDDRGITYGFCGFTTGTGDGVMVVEEYTKLKPNNPLARYLPALRSVAGQGDVFTGLDGFEAAVGKLGDDKDFIQAQWMVCDDQYGKPAEEWCKKIECRHALTKAQLHDALVNHGEGLGDKFSVDYIFQAAEKAAGGTPATGVDEAKWLAAFLQARYNLLASWDSTSAASVNRIKIYQELLKLGDLNLDGPIYIDLTAPSTTPDGKKVWQVKNVYYGTFLIYSDPNDPNRRLELIA